jgi:hypothetical protein
MKSCMVGENATCPALSFLHFPSARETAWHLSSSSFSYSSIWVSDAGKVIVFSKAFALSKRLCLSMNFLYEDMKFCMQHASLHCSFLMEGQTNIGILWPNAFWKETSIHRARWLVRGMTASNGRYFHPLGLWIVGFPRTNLPGMLLSDE